ncbi:MAG: DUF2380 domain-containing protein, partial [Hyphomicrobiaceae bacterium]
MSTTRILAPALLLIFATAATGTAAPKTAIFPFELIDTSLEGELGGIRADETRRLVLATEELRRLVAQDGR